MSETQTTGGSASERPVTWISMLRTIRSPFAILLLAGVALLVPAQTADMLAALGDGRGSISATIRFHAALAFLALSAWYWSRALVAARFDVPDTAEARHEKLGANQRAYDTVPRLMYVLALLTGFGMILRSGAWSSLGWMFVWAVPLGFAVYFRTRLERRLFLCLGLQPPAERTQPHRQWIGKTSNVCVWVHTLRPRFYELIERAPWPNWFSIVLFAVAMLVFAWGTLDAFVPWPTDWHYPGLPALAVVLFPGPAVALAGLALIIGPLSVLTFLFDGLDISVSLFGLRVLRRPPVVTALVAWVLIAPTVFSLHTVRVITPADGGMAPDARQDLATLFAAWAVQCQTGATVRPVIVAVSGGASRAAIWGERVLFEVEQDTGQAGARIFAVSSVSGGSLGVAAYMAAVAGMKDGDRCTNDDARHALMNVLKNHELSEDALGPLLAGALLVDIPRALFTPLPQIVRGISGRDPRGGDRAEALERAFETLWAGVAKNTKPEPFGFERSYLSLFYADAAPRPGMPVWIANGTDMATGNRLVTVPFDPRKAWPLPAAEDVLAALGADVPVSTAINNTARFPYLEPSGELLAFEPHDRKALPPLDRRRQPDGTAREVIDGGYFENEGLQTALDLAGWLRLKGPPFVNGRAVEPIIVEATGDGDVLPSEAVVRCGSRGDDPLEIATTRRPLQLLAPLLGLYGVRAGHSAVLLREARAAYCPSDAAQIQGLRFFHFYLPADGAEPVPLNWILSDSTARFIWDGAMQQGGNPREAERMREVLKAP